MAEGRIAADAPLTEDQVRADLEQMAAELPYLALRSALYDRPHYFVVAEPQKKETHDRILKRIGATHYSKQALWELLTHADPKVRTLALVALYSREDATVLPAIVDLVGDTARTFDGRPKRAPLPPGVAWGVGPPERVQEVDDFARAMLRLYLEPAGFYWGSREVGSPTHL
jgi:hypothetical protein